MSGDHHHGRLRHHPRQRAVRQPGRHRLRRDGTGRGYFDTTYVQHVDTLVDYLFTGSILTEPFGRYEQFFDAWRVNVVSADPALDDPTAGVFRDTALDATDPFDGFTQRLLLSMSARRRDRHFRRRPGGQRHPPDMIFVTVNDTQYGGGGGLYAVYAGGNAARARGRGARGRAFLRRPGRRVWRRPEAHTGPEPAEPNITIDPTGAKWAAWLGYDQPGFRPIGAYEGGYYQDLGI